MCALLKQMSIFTGFGDALDCEHDDMPQLEPRGESQLDWTRPRPVVHSEELLGRPANRTEPLTTRIDRMLHGVVDDLLQGHLPALAFVDAPFSSRHGSTDRNVRSKAFLSSADSKASERFCRAMIVMDAVQVCNCMFTVVETC